MTSATSRIRLRVRAALLLGIGAFMLVSPLHRVLGGRSPWLRDWLLYRDVGVGLVTAQFHVVADGREAAIDRFAVLKARRGPASPITHIRGEEGLERVCRQLCAALGPGTDLRVRARIATRTGWADIDDGSRDRCSPQPPRPVRVDATPRRLHD